MKLSVIFQFGQRPYLEKIARDFLKESLGDFPYEWIELDCSNLTIGAGFNRLAEQVKTEYVMNTLDDFGFFPNGNWAEKAIKILESRKDIGLVNLRKEKDNEGPWSLDSREWAGDVPFFTYYAWAGRGFSFNPSIMRTETLRKIIPLEEKDPHGNVAEAVGWERWKKLGLDTAKLDIPYYGVCFHLGWNRSRARGYREP